MAVLVLIRITLKSRTQNGTAIRHPVRCCDSCPVSLRAQPIGFSHATPKPFLSELTKVAQRCPSDFSEQNSQNITAWSQRARNSHSARSFCLMGKDTARNKSKLWRGGTWSRILVQPVILFLMIKQSLSTILLTNSRVCNRDEKESRKWAKAKIPCFAGLWLPEAPADELRTLIDFLNWASDHV